LGVQDTAMSSKRITRRAEFEKLGVEYARLCVATGNDAAAEASAWLAELKDEQELEAASKRDAREIETLRIASRANKIAIIAAVAATIAAIAAIISATISIVSISTTP
jgi:hypothetical protein